MYKGVNLGTFLSSLLSTVFMEVTKLCGIPLFLWNINLGLITNRINRIGLKSMQGRKEKKSIECLSYNWWVFKIFVVKNKYLHHSTASGELIKECPFILECQEQFNLKMVLDG